MHPASNPATALSYLNVAPPATGELARVADGVFWIRLPLPMELDHINLWLLEHAEGYVLVDTGLASDASRAAWQLLEPRALDSRPLRLIVVTHLHPDHAGLAAWLQVRHRVPVWTSRETERQMRQLLEPPSDERLASRRAFFRAHGLTDADSLGASLTGERYRAHVSGVPAIAHHPEDSEEVTWDTGTWRWLATGGHAAGHLCLHEPTRRVLITGDQILPTISPNVSLNGWSADANPLDSYLRSLERLAGLDERTLVLPSHGRPFVGVGARAHELREHHGRQLDQLLAACHEPCTAHDTLRVLFRRPLAGFHRFLALGEAIAHLEYLAIGGRLVRLTDAEGTIRYARAA
ncbi:MAG TPA: MBL fold metallo-hydrolase [Steroidobacteraceae bacterium]|nr:MBL fold metallo-hydrolase [Steroidobacteraceae bacterium]